MIVIKILSVVSKLRSWIRTLRYRCREIVGRLEVEIMDSNLKSIIGRILLANWRVGHVQGNEPQGYSWEEIVGWLHPSTPIVTLQASTRRFYNWKQQAWQWTIMPCPIKCIMALDMVGATTPPFTPPKLWNTSPHTPTIPS